MVNVNEIDEYFRILNRWCLKLPDYQERKIVDYLSVGDWHSALDTIAARCLDANVSMPPGIFAIFRNMAFMLTLEHDPDYNAIEKLIARHPDAA